MRIACAQTVPRPGDVAANVAEHVRLAEEAADGGASVVVFPELSLTGYELDRAERLAFTDGDTRLDPLVALARSRGITLVVGAPLRRGAALHLGAWIVRPDGIDRYTKRHLGAFPASANPDGPVPPPEPSVFTAGDDDPLVAIGHERAAVAICADVGHPDHAARAADRGATIYLASMFVIPAEFDEAMSRLRDRAARHGMTVAFANYGGPSGGLPSAGRSAILAPDGTERTLPATGAAVLTAGFCP